MSAHYSKWNLNTYLGTPYFQAFLPEHYPVSLMLQKARAFRRLPPNLRALAGKAKQWVVKNGGDLSEVNRWYDAAGNELDPDTGRVLTDEEIDAQWQDDPDLLHVPMSDIPTPPDRLPDPETWVPPTIEATADEDRPPSEEQLRRDIASHGYARTAAEYGIAEGDLPQGVEPLKAMPDEEGGEGDEEVLGIATGELYNGPPVS